VCSPLSRRLSGAKIQDNGTMENGEWRLENNSEMKMKMGEKTDNAGRS